METQCNKCGKGYVSKREYKEDEFKTEPVNCSKCGMTIFTNDIVPSMKTIKSVINTYQVKHEFCSNVMCDYKDTSRTVLIP